MKNITTLLALLLTLTAAGQRQNTTTTKRLIVDDSIRFRGVWYKSWGGSGSGSAWNIGGNTLGASPGKFGTIDSVPLRVFSFNREAITINPTNNLPVWVNSIIPDNDSSNQVATTAWIMRNIVRRYFFENPLTVSVDTIRCIGCGGGGSGSAWNISGNTGTNAATNYIGTADNVPAVFKSNAVEVFRISPDSANFSRNIVLNPSGSTPNFSRQLLLRGRGADGSFQNGSIYLEADGSGLYGGALAINSVSGSYNFYPKFDGTNYVSFLGNATLRGVNSMDIISTTGVVAGNNNRQTTGNVFAVKNGTGFGSTKNYLVVNSSGNVGIGDSLTNALAKLQVVGDGSLSALFTNGGVGINTTPEQMAGHVLWINGKMSQSVLFDSLSTFTVRASSNFVLNNPTNGNDYLVANQDGQFYITGTSNETTRSNTFEIGGDGNLSLKSVNSTVDNYILRYQLGAGDDIVNAYYNSVRFGVNKTTPSASLHISPVVDDLTPVIIEGLPVFADDTAAGAGGLTANMLYKTATGVLMVKN